LVSRPLNANTFGDYIYAQERGLMEKAESVLQWLGLPEQFGATLLIVCLVLSIAPYFSGADFGILKLPSFKPVIRRNLRFAGPIALAVAIFLHIPFFQDQSGLDPREPPPSVPHQEGSSPNFPSRPTTTEEMPMLSRSLTAGLYRVNLLIPTSMSDADVWLDGRKARILKRTPNLITIEIPAGSSNQQVKIQKEGSPICVTTLSVNENGTTLTPCQD
jgi:hypothetical protein